MINDLLLMLASFSSLISSYASGKSLTYPLIINIIKTENNYLKIFINYNIKKEKTLKIKYIIL